MRGAVQRRRKATAKRRKARNDILWAAGVLGLFVAVAVGQWVNRHRGVAVTVALILAAAAAAVLVVRTRAQRDRHRARLAGLRDVAAYQRMDPSQFERALAALCERDGCRNVRVVGGAGDLAADVLATTPTGQRMLIQAKRYQAGNKVGSPEVQCVGGTFRVVHGADLAAVVTTSAFTSAAVAYARQAGIRLVDSDGLAAWASGSGGAPWR